jgi:hypothetical protein
MHHSDNAIGRGELIAIIWGEVDPDAHEPAQCLAGAARAAVGAGHVFSVREALQHVKRGAGQERELENEAMRVTRLCVCRHCRRQRQLKSTTLQFAACMPRLQCWQPALCHQTT